MIGLALVVAAYLVGSVATAVLVCRLLGLPDPRTSGSRNPGATNVLRLGGKRAAAVTLAGDVLKGALPVLAARLVTDEPAALVAVALAAFLGHLYPVFFRFRGGKGVATALGATAALSWPLGAAAAATWLLIAALWRYSSLASMTAAALAPLYAALLGLGALHVIGVGLLSALLIARHRDNIERLLAGTEGRIRSPTAPR